jgi:hypothetical protein
VASGMSPMIGTYPCEVCEAPVRCMPFPGLHILCTNCSTEMNRELRPFIDQLIERMKEARRRNLS